MPSNYRVVRIVENKYNKYFDIDKNFDPQSRKNIKNELVKKCENSHLNSIEMSNEIAEEICKTNNIKFDKNKFFKKLLDTTIIDYFLSNPDRNFSNILLFINTNNEKQLEMLIGPVFDNGYGLGIRSYYSQLYNNITPEVYDYTDLALGISKKSQLNAHVTNDVFILDLIQASKNYPKQQQMINNFLQLDMDKVISLFEIKENFELDSDLRKYIVDTFNKRVENYKEIDCSLLKIAKACNVREKDIASYKLLKRSVDARDKNNVCFVM